MAYETEMPLALNCSIACDRPLLRRISARWELPL